jgi:hypothetical protein
MHPKNLLLLVTLFILSFCSGQEPQTAIAYADSVEISTDIFAEDTPGEITLTFNLKQYQKKKYTDEYLPAQLVVGFSDSVSVKHDVRVKARGNNRRERCTLPPLWLNIKKADLPNETLKGTKKMKLVTHCANAKAYEPYILKEYLAYKIYNIISPNSFRVRLIRIKYIDTGRKHKETNAFAFLIEPETMMAERLRLLPLKYDKISIKVTDTAATDIMALFQYMIGNSDYSVTGRHNVKLLTNTNPFNRITIPVPYDFDYTGLVNAHYAVPGENLGIKSVTERYYLGACRPSGQHQTTIDYFFEKKDEIFELVKDFEYLSEKDREAVVYYLETFFNDAATKYFIGSSLESTCR